MAGSSLAARIERAAHVFLFNQKLQAAGRCSSREKLHSPDDFGTPWFLLGWRCRHCGTWISDRQYRRLQQIDTAELTLSLILTGGKMLRWWK